MTRAQLPPLSGRAAADLATVADACRTHHVVMVGPPGVGKTMIARRIRDTMPPLTDPAERWAVAAVQYVAQGGHTLAASTRRIGTYGTASRGIEIVDARPFRAPHHTVSVAGLGGSVNRVKTGEYAEGPLVRRVYPGEVTLAHCGVLFLDELPEFSRRCLDTVCEAMREGSVRLVRSFAAYDLPAGFRLIAAMTACPCGFVGHPERACVCPYASIDRYQRRVARIVARDDVQVVEIGGDGIAAAGFVPGQGVA